MKTRSAFSLVELLVVIGIIAVLISMLLPALNKANQQAKRVQCSSNLRQCGVFLQMYANENNGWIVPVGAWIPQPTSTNPNAGMYESLGTNMFLPPLSDVSTPSPWLTWPAVVFKMNAPTPNATTPNLDPYNYAPNIMRCPVDEGSIDDLSNGMANLNNCWGGHSYVINKHLCDFQNQVKKYSSKMGSGLDVSKVPLLGEKIAGRPDYYLEVDDSGTESEYNGLIAIYKHGTGNKLGANYLFMDLHVDSQEPSLAYSSLDPWDMNPGATGYTN